MTFHRSLAILALATLGSTACDDATDPDLPDVPARYEATTFIGHADAGDVDVLAAGGSITLELDADGTTTGTMFVPGGDEDGSDYTADLTGTWTLNGDLVTLDHAADTFLRDVTFTYDDGRLVSESAFADVVLTRQ